MSEEAFRIMTQMDLEGAETQAVLQCAPLLTGIKMSNLLHVREGQQREVASMFEATPVSSRILYKKNGRISVFLYREQRLKRFLSVGKVRRLLDSFGYRGMELPEILSRLSDRYQRHMDGRGDFPHEIGLLLGYPPEDVSGFIENGGKNFLCSGYWKVYKDPARARRIFDGNERPRAAAFLKAVGDGGVIGGIMADVRHISEVSMDSLREAQVFAMGCPAMGAEVLEEGEMEPFVMEVEGFAQGKRIGLFGSYGWGDGQWMRDWEERMKAAGAVLVGREGVIANEAPDEDALEQCRALGRELASI